MSTSTGNTISRPLGGTGLSSFPLVLDGSTFGWASGTSETNDVLDRFVEVGGTVVTTADHYAGGRSEIMLGNWMRDRGLRDRMIVGTKVGRHPDAAGLSAAAIRRGVEASLGRLGTDRIDFLALDGDHPETPFDETLEAISRLVSAGTVRFLSVAGFRPERIVELDALAELRGQVRLSGILVTYNLIEREAFERAVAPMASRYAVFARFPLASGYLAGMLRSREQLPSSVMYAAAREHIGRRGERVLAALDRVAKERGDATLAAVSLAWLLARPGDLFPVIRAATGEQCASYLGAVDLKLSRHQLVALDRASA